MNSVKQDSRRYGLHRLRACGMRIHIGNLNVYRDSAQSTADDGDRRFHFAASSPARHPVAAS